MSGSDSHVVSRPCEAAVPLETLQSRPRRRTVEHGWSTDSREKTRQADPSISIFKYIVIYIDISLSICFDWHLFIRVVFKYLYIVLFHTYLHV